MIKHLSLSILFLLQTGSVLAFSPKDPQLFMHNGIERIYYLNVPENLPRNSPLIVALHGMGGQAHRMRYGLGLHDLAFEKNFAVVFPQGETFGENTTYWNAGEGPGEHDDIGFLTELIDEIIQEHGLDPDRVFVLGISNGAQMAFHLACESPQHIAGIGIVIGTITASDWSSCPMEEPVSLLHIHGVLDTVMKFEGGISWQSDRAYPPVPVILRFWADALDAELVVPVEIPKNTQVTRYENQFGAVAQLVAIDNFGHDWPHHENAGFSASELITDFFFSLPPD